ncbi:MAG TPA: antibiotic biosynthesis monooxygenase [Puia sp.]|nr:antibiotic biosynthesis monooxygenase [Puia sp.]
MRIKKLCLSNLIIAILIMTFGFCKNASAQSNSHYIRIAKLVIDSARLDSYKLALKEHAETAVKVEPGVLMLYAVYEKDHPTRVNVFEIYADMDAYQSHIKTAHFLKYKAAVQDMVKSLELIDVAPIALEAKNQISNGFRQ